jgi:hypothetical protein
MEEFPAVESGRDVWAVRDENAQPERSRKRNILI